jgi:ATP-binding cassette subfamily C protein
MRSDERATISATHPRSFGRAMRTFLTDLAEISAASGAWAIAYALAAALLDSVSISLLIPLLSLIFTSPTMPGWMMRGALAVFRLAGVTSQLERLILLLGLFGALIAARACVVSARDIAIFTIQQRFIEEQRLRITKRLTAASWFYISRLRHARITHLMSGDIQRLGTGIQFILIGAGAAAMLLAQLALAAILSPLLAGLVALLFCAAIVPLKPALARAREIGSHTTDANLLLIDETAQFLSAIKMAISQNIEGKFVRETGQTLRAIGRHQAHFTSRHILIQAILTVSFAGVGAALVFIGVTWTHTAPAVLVTLLLLITRMAGPAWQVQNAAHHLANVVSIHERIVDLDSELFAAARNETDSSRVCPTNGPITFEHVSYIHSEDSKTGQTGETCRGVRDLNLVIADGDFLGITGPSGSGKTTFADLLVGLLTPQRGRISIGAIVLDDSTRLAWRRTLSYVSQDPFLFHDTLRHNLGWSGASEKEMWQALALTGSATLVRNMDRGLDSVVGERGALLSGGERQRIAISRALLRRPRLLVLDEATGAIDSAAERRIFESLQKMPNRPTVVLIAHRTENLDICDRIVNFEAGTIHQTRVALASSR